MTPICSSPERQPTRAPPFPTHLCGISQHRHRQCNNSDLDQASCPLALALGAEHHAIQPTYRHHPLARSRGHAETVQNSLSHAIRLSGMRANPILEEAAGFFDDHHEFSRVESHSYSDSVPFGKQ